VRNASVRFDFEVASGRVARSAPPAEGEPDKERGEREAEPPTPVAVTDEPGVRLRHLERPGRDRAEATTAAGPRPLLTFAETTAEPVDDPDDRDDGPVAAFYRRAVHRLDAGVLMEPGEESVER
jgi:hypothetical protein